MEENKTHKQVAPTRLVAIHFTSPVVYKLYKVSGWAVTELSDSFEYSLSFWQTMTITVPLPSYIAYQFQNWISGKKEISRNLDDRAMPKMRID